MKLKSLMLKNFGAVSEVSVNFSDSLTYFIGNNGSGKTTLGLLGVWFILQGLAAKAIAGTEVLLADRYRFIGPHGKSAKGTIEVYDEKAKATHTITRKLLKHKTDLEITSSDGVERGQEFLDNLFSAILIDPRRFFKMSGKEQALAFGVDTSEFDDQRKGLGAERLEIRREMKRLKEVIKSEGETEKVEEVSVASLLEELKKRQEINQDNKTKRLDARNYELVADSQQEIVDTTRAETQRLQAVLLEGEKKLAACDEKAAGLTKIAMNLQDADEQEVQDQLSAAEEINARARAYSQSLANQKAHKNEQAKYSAKDNEIAVLDAKRTKYIQAQKLPFNNITINENGEFRIDGKPFQEPYFSEGEALKFGAILGSKIAERRGGDKLDYVWISCCQDLDDENCEKLFAALAKAGLQVACEFVGTKKQKKGYSILLKEMKVVESYSEKPGAELE